MTGKYDDIINLPHHVSKKHPQMSIRDRAAQFAPFAALVGYEDEIKESARTTGEFHPVLGREKEEIDQKLLILQQNQYRHPLVSINYFVPDTRKKGGSYKKIEEHIEKIDVVNKHILMKNGTVILFEYIKELNGEIFHIVMSKKDGTIAEEI